MHYRRWYRTGDPNSVKRRVGRTETERFWEYVEKTSSCWLWTGAKSHGYGNFYVSNGDGTSRQVQAHRWAYEHSIGPVPRGLVLDHLCRVRHCVRPQHLQPVRQQVNILRGDLARALRENACVNGHDYTPENTYINTAGARVCRMCQRVSGAAFRARRRAARSGTST
jgi:hypothetical protein